MKSHERTGSLVISDNDVPRGADQPEITFSADGSQLEFRGLGTTTWDVKSATQLSATPIGTLDATQKTLPWVGDKDLTASLRHPTLSPDGKWYAAMFINSTGASIKQTIKLWRRASLKKIWEEVTTTTFPTDIIGKGLIYNISISNNGGYLVVGTRSEIQIYSTAPFKLQKTIPVVHPILGSQFSSGDRYLVICGDNSERGTGGSIKFWKVGDWKLEHEITSPKLLRYPVLSRDEKQVAAVEADATVFVCPSPISKEKTN